VTYDLENFAADIKAVLLEDPSEEGPSRIVPLVQRALLDQQFLMDNFGPDKPGPRHIIHEDAELGFCICVHVYHDGNNGAPHDHGPSWAVYGQVEGTTEMTHWAVVRPADDEKPALVEQYETLTLKPGEAHYYRPGAVHAPMRAGPVKLLRIEGKNLDTVTRTPIEIAGHARN
jgi:predicted metal-dependent enzyme (double-stranded beta helix superfamily)